MSIEHFLTYSQTDPDANDDCFGTANINLSNGNVWVCNNATRRYELATTLKLVTQSQIGPAAGQIPVIPVPMLQMSPGVKTTLDAVNANADSAAFHPASAFATTAQGALASTALQSVLAASLVASGLMSAADFANLQFLVSLLPYDRRPQVVKHSVSIGTANSDALIITEMPAKYLITRLSIFNASSALSTVTAGLYTSSGGVGAIVGPSTITAANANVFFDYSGLALTVRTNTPLYFHVVTPKAATTVSVLIEFLNLT